MSDYPLVTVTWLDTLSVATWTPLEEFAEMEPQVCESVGWLLSETDGPGKAGVIRLLTTGAGGEVSGTIIPMGCVTSIHRHSVG